MTRPYAGICHSVQIAPNSSVGGDGKIVALYGPGICSLRYRSSPALFRQPEFSETYYHSPMPEDIYVDFSCEKMQDCVQGGVELTSLGILIHINILLAKGYNYI